MNRIEISQRLPDLIREPAVVTWNRLEGRPRTADFSRALRAEVRDALWMLTRQWQFGEFQGEDAGSAVLAKAQLETTRITRYSQRDQPATAFPTDLPLEARVEREAIPLDLLTCLQMGRYWLTLLQQTFGDDRYRLLFRAAYPITLPSEDVANAPFHANSAAVQLAHATQGRGMDGGAFYRALVAGLAAETVTTGGMSVAPADQPQVADAAQTFLATYADLFTDPTDSADTAWIPEKLEYQFACSAPPNTVLTAEAYYHGRLDWYSFDVDPTRETLPTDTPPDENVIQRTTFSFLPTPARFAGMPAVRWWEFEEGRTNFGAIRVDTTDIAHLLLAEFGVIYGNDWMVIPYEVPVGSLCAVRGLVVTDTFGQQTWVRAAGRGADDNWHRWTMFNMSVVGDTGQADTRLFVPPAIGKAQEGEPIEKITFLRDEMANMVWAVESLLPNERQGSMDGYHAATKGVEYIKSLLGDLPPDPAVIETEALIRYIAGTTVPENWIPFIPVHVPGSNREIQLQRARMLRTFVRPATPVEPRSVILRHGLPTTSYTIHEEEVPRAGAVVTRAFQRARWQNGKTYLWLGRRKQVGRGEGSSGLRFDALVPVRREESP